MPRGVVYFQSAMLSALLIYFFVEFMEYIVLCSDVAVKSRLSGEAGNDSDGSSDSSEEDLDSPRVIRSAPVASSSEPVVTGSGGLATSEKMDVDSGIVKLKHYITYCIFSK